MSSEDTLRDLQRISLNKVDKVHPHRLDFLRGEGLIVEEETCYRLTNAGEELRMKLFREGIKDTSFCTLGDMLRAKGQST